MILAVIVEKDTKIVAAEVWNMVRWLLGGNPLVGMGHLQASIQILW